MILLRAADVQRYTTPNALVTPLATARLGAQQVSVIRQQMAAGNANPIHAQTHEEVMVVLDGQVTATVNDTAVQLAAGDTLILPAYTPHRIDNHGPGDAIWLIISPAGMAFLGADAQPRTPDWAR